MNYWEKIDKETERMEVSEGWVVAVINGWGNRMPCFVPDKKHSWKIKPYKEAKK